MSAKFYELTPRYDSRQSFYGKAHIVEDDDLIQLQSYETIVVDFNRETLMVELSGEYSRTTSRHIAEFLHWLGDHYIDHNVWEAVRTIQEEQKIRSFAEFLRRVRWMDFTFGLYSLNDKEQVFEL